MDQLECLICWGRRNIVEMKQWIITKYSTLSTSNTIINCNRYSWFSRMGMNMTTIQEEMGKCSQLTDLTTKATTIYLT
jgi:hypothetical protein